MMQGRWVLSEALRLAEQREAERRQRLAAELAEMRKEGALVHVTASELALLEDNGMVYDFSTGLVQGA